MEHRRSSSIAHGSTTRDSQHTSSAFSASAQPNEDWTKISDLAERRRIQNRIAQRNYRKKLKKRLEDLERKAASASPEPTPAELPAKLEKPKPKSAVHKRRPSQSARQDSAPAPPQLGTSTSEDWSMFSNQYTRQISTSPPPFSFPNIDAFPTPPSPQLPNGNFSCMPSAPMEYGMESNLPYMSYQQSYDTSSQFQWQDKTLPIKHEGLFDNEVNPLSIADYMPLGISFPAGALPDAMFADAAFSESSLTPELCDIYEHSSAGSPGEFHAFPQTPLMMPLSPPFSTAFEQ